VSEKSLTPHPTQYRSFRRRNNLGLNYLPWFPVEQRT